MTGLKQFAAIFIMSFKYLWASPLGYGVIIIAPIVFILVLGNALGAYISPDTDFDAIPIAYVTDDGESAFARFIMSGKVAQFLETAAMTDEAAARSLLSEGAVRLIVVERDREISAVGPGTASNDTNIVLSVLDAYKNQAAAAEIAVANGENPLDVMARMNSELISGFTVNAMPIGNRAPSGTDYYAVTMLVYILLLAGMNGMELFNKSLLNDTGARILTAPASKPIVIGSLVIASTVSSFLQGMVTFVFSAVVCGVDWGERVWLVLLTLFVVVLFSQALAIFLLLALRSPAAAAGAMQGIFWTTTMVSKGYAKISFGELADKIFAYAPNALAHTTIFGAIFGGNESRMMFCLALLFAMAAAFFALAFIFGRRRLA